MKKQCIYREFELETGFIWQKAQTAPDSTPTPANERQKMEEDIAKLTSDERRAESEKLQRYISEGRNTPEDIERLNILQRLELEALAPPDSKKPEELVGNVQKKTGKIKSIFRQFMSASEVNDRFKGVLSYVMSGTGFVSRVLATVFATSGGILFAQNYFEAKADGENMALIASLESTIMAKDNKDVSKEGDRILAAIRDGIMAEDVKPPSEPDSSKLRQALFDAREFIRTVNDGTWKPEVATGADGEGDAETADATGTETKSVVELPSDHAAVVAAKAQLDAIQFQHTDQLGVLLVDYTKNTDELNEQRPGLFVADAAGAMVLNTALYRIPSGLDQIDGKTVVIYNTNPNEYKFANTAQDNPQLVSIEQSGKAEMYDKLPTKPANDNYIVQSIPNPDGELGNLLKRSPDGLGYVSNKPGIKILKREDGAILGAVAPDHVQGMIWVSPDDPNNFDVVHVFSIKSNVTSTNDQLRNELTGKISDMEHLITLPVGGSDSNPTQNAPEGADVRILRIQSSDGFRVQFLAWPNEGYGWSSDVEDPTNVQPGDLNIQLIGGAAGDTESNDAENSNGDTRIAMNPDRQKASSNKFVELLKAYRGGHINPIWGYYKAMYNAVQKSEVFAGVDLDRVSGIAHVGSIGFMRSADEGMSHIIDISDTPQKIQVLIGAVEKDVGERSAQKIHDLLVESGVLHSDSKMIANAEETSAETTLDDLNVPETTEAPKSAPAPKPEGSEIEDEPETVEVPPIKDLRYENLNVLKATMDVQDDVKKEGRSVKLNLPAGASLKSFDDMPDGGVKVLATAPFVGEKEKVLTKQEWQAQLEKVMASGVSDEILINDKPRVTLTITAEV